jgi:hypothetical protein
MTIDDKPAGETTGVRLDMLLEEVEFLKSMRVIPGTPGSPDVHD